MSECEECDGIGFVKSDGNPYFTKPCQCIPGEDIIIFTDRFEYHRGPPLRCPVCDSDCIVGHRKVELGYRVDCRACESFWVGGYVEFENVVVMGEGGHRAIRMKGQPNWLIEAASHLSAAKEVPAAGEYFDKGMDIAREHIRKLIAEEKFDQLGDELSHVNPVKEDEHLVRAILEETFEVADKVWSRFKLKGGMPDE